MGRGAEVCGSPRAVPGASVQEQAEGFVVRQLAVEALAAVLESGVSLDVFASSSERVQKLASRDIALFRAITLAALRHKEQIDAVLAQFLARPLPRKSGIARRILEAGAAQLLFTEIPAYAIIDTSVRLAKRDRNATHFAGVVNAVLRKLASGANQDLPPPAVAPWLEARWNESYGVETTARMAAASLTQAPLDLTAKSSPEIWAEKLGGVVLPTGSIRLDPAPGTVEALPGFGEGAWWVQDVAAAVPARLFGDVTGKKVLDLCAAPGGKTLQLAASGAGVTAVDQSAARLMRLKDNLRRTHLEANMITADVLEFEPPSQFDCVLLDAPCSATGTIRRHPDLPYLKSSQQIAELAGLQRRLLDRSARFVKPGGILIYCTCSLEPEEGEAQIAGFLDSHPEYLVWPVAPSETGLEPHMITGNGFFRSRPDMAAGSSRGMDGFFAARLTRSF